MADDQIRDIRNGLSADDARVIFSKMDTGKDFLGRLGVSVGSSAKADDVWRTVVANWDYETALPKVREMFRETDKYRSGADAGSLLTELTREWRDKGLGPISWPISQAQFDTLAQRINTSPQSRTDKDRAIQLAAVQFRRMKELVTARNDLIEKLIFDANDEIIPTLQHTRAADFFIRGERFDQKVSKSVGGAFRDKYGVGWRSRAIDHPEDVARSLYENQDADRFSDGPRLLVVDVDGAAFDPAEIRKAVAAAGLARPIEVSFSYEHVGGKETDYTARCIVVLLTDRPD